MSVEILTNLLSLVWLHSLYKFVGVVKINTIWFRQNYFYFESQCDVLL